jgi:tetratricopeptide (TPR) repeat protein
MSGASEPVGTLEVALSHASRLLQSHPTLAAEQAAEILKVVPNHPVALLLLGQALGASGQGDAAVDALRRAVQVRPDLGDAWLALGDHLTAIGDTQGADEAYARHIKCSTRNPRLLSAAVSLVEGRIAPAEQLLREHLKQYPTDVAAIRMFAEVAIRLGRYTDAENLLARCLELSPSFAPARHHYAIVLHRENKEAAALVEVDRLLAAEPRNPSYRSLKAAILGSLGEYEGSIELYGGLLAEYPNHHKAWMSYGHSLKTAGRQDEAIRAYRKSIELRPEFGEAYWSLANLKTFRFSAEDLQTMRAQLARADLSDDDRFHFHFAIGKALEDSAEFAGSFQHYLEGNRLRRAGIEYSADETASHVTRSKAVLTRAFFAERAGSGYDAPDPIFIVGLPRSGSTLLEQILSSHSAVEGTMELPDIIAMARQLGGKKTRTQTSNYPEVLQSLSHEELRALGQQYIEQTRVHRKTGAPFFIDKMPNNFAHTGLIHLMLPNSKIIDARRHPLGCCLSGFKQHFARGQHFTYSLDDIGRYYRDYVELMAHFDEALPGRVHRVIYETMIDDTENEVRRVLEHCGLPFEEQCLRFYQNERAVRTASSEQVRRPIFREGVEQWRHYEPWLEPLKQALGPVLTNWGRER